MGGEPAIFLRKLKIACYKALASGFLVRVPRPSAGGWGEVFLAGEGVQLGFQPKLPFHTLSHIAQVGLEFPVCCTFTSKCRDYSNAFIFIIGTKKREVMRDAKDVWNCTLAGA